jgi:hypothetical protein
MTRVPARMFSAGEIQAHKNKLQAITTTGAKYLDDIYADHVAFYNQWGVSKYYGNRRKDYQTRAGRVAALQALGKPAFLADQQVGTACILLAMQCLKQGFGAAGLSSIWDKIYGILKIDNAFYGTDLQLMLQQLGWKIYYWNPNPSKNAAWDEEDRRLNPPKPGKTWNPVWGGHLLRYNSVVNRGIYYETKVDNNSKLVNFGTAPPASFKNVPLFIGIAHAGYHVFPGRRGDVIEAHSMRNLDARDNLEVAPFNPLAVGGAPRWTRSEKYRSGLMAVPQNF